MAAARHVGRIGSLAFALGIGAGLSCATGIAWADASDQSDAGPSRGAAPVAGRSSAASPRGSSTGPSARSTLRSRPSRTGDDADSARPFTRLQSRPPDLARPQPAGPNAEEAREPPPGPTASTQQPDQPVSDGAPAAAARDAGGGVAPVSVIAPSAATALPAHNPVVSAPAGSLRSLSSPAGMTPDAGAGAPQLRDKRRCCSMSRPGRAATRSPALRPRKPCPRLSRPRPAHPRSPTSGDTPCSANNPPRARSKRPGSRPRA